MSIDYQTIGMPADLVYEQIRIRHGEPLTKFNACSILIKDQLLHIRLYLMPKCRPIYIPFKMKGISITLEL